MGEVNLLDSYPRVKCPIKERARAKRLNPEIREIVKRFDKEYFDGDRLYGCYGGYYYDGRWQAVARRMRDYYGLSSEHSVLDVGCAKGFLLHDLRQLIPGITVVGIDISVYAIQNAMEDVKPFCIVGNAGRLPFPDKSFDLVISINTVHNLPFAACCRAIMEIERVGRRWKYIQVDSWRTERERENLKAWTLTSETEMSVEEWKAVFNQIGYTGDYYWTIIE